jgi:transposase
MVTLSEEERAALRTLVSSGTGPAALLTHARILLKANQGEGGAGWTDAAIAGALEVGLSTVARVRQTYATLGLEAALARKAPQRVYERKLDGAQEARLVALTCSAPPAGQKRWTLRLLAEQLVALAVVDTIAPETVRQTLKQTR